jgi:hypothetical protein
MIVPSTILVLGAGELGMAGYEKGTEGMRGGMTRNRTDRLGGAESQLSSPNLYPSGNSLDVPDPGSRPRSLVSQGGVEFDRLSHSGNPTV